jgi:hypothetical protein
MLAILLLMWAINFVVLASIGSAVRAIRAQEPPNLALTPAEVAKRRILGIEQGQFLNRRALAYCSIAGVFTLPECLTFLPRIQSQMTEIEQMGNAIAQYDAAIAAADKEIITARGLDPAKYSIVSDAKEGKIEEKGAKK